MFIKNHILVVDDDLNTREVLADLLKESAYSVDIAANAKEAFLSIERKKPEVIVLDTILPECDGFGICQKVKNSIDRTIKVIMYTGYVEAVNIAKARTCGADDFLGKTTDFKNIEQAIKKLINQ